jgi:hypothetical protein
MVTAILTITVYGARLMLIRSKRKLTKYAIDKMVQEINEFVDADDEKIDEEENTPGALEQEQAISGRRAKALMPVVGLSRPAEGPEGQPAKLPLSAEKRNALKEISWRKRSLRHLSI